MLRCHGNVEGLRICVCTEDGLEASFGSSSRSGPVSADDMHLHRLFLGDAKPLGSLFSLVVRHLRERWSYMRHFVCRAQFVPCCG